jgi:hypothetical protein
MSGESEVHMRVSMLMTAVMTGLLLLRPAVLQAQVLSGVVTDEDNLSLPGVTITVIGGSISQVRVSDESGRYSFRELPPGIVHVFMELASFRTISRDVEISAGAPTTADVVLRFDPRNRPDIGADDVTAYETAASMPRGFRWLWIETKDRVRSFPYDSITFESFGCLGACRAYTLTLSRSGRAELDAVANLRQEKGHYVGRFDDRYFGRLCLLMQRSGFQTFAPRYVASFTDAGGERIRATSGSQSWTVEEEGWSGPIELWGIEEALDHMVDRISWRLR